MSCSIQCQAMLRTRSRNFLVPSEPYCNKDSHTEYNILITSPHAINIYCIVNYFTNSSGPKIHCRCTHALFQIRNIVYRHLLIYQVRIWGVYRIIPSSLISFLIGSMPHAAASGRSVHTLVRQQAHA
jgi:hypothetical protein